MDQEHVVAESLVSCTALDFCGVASVGGGKTGQTSLQLPATFSERCAFCAVFFCFLK